MPICAPNLSRFARSYREQFNDCRSSHKAMPKHNDDIGILMEQSLKKDALDSSGSHDALRHLENLVLGDANVRGKTHQWMYDCFNLKHLLKISGLRGVKIFIWNECSIPNWKEMNPEMVRNGQEHMDDFLDTEFKK